MSDFVNEEIVRFEVNGKEYGFKPTTAGEENEWVDEYIEKVKKPNGKGGYITEFNQNMSKLNMCKLRNLKEVPWDKEELKEVFGFNKGWSQLNKKERERVLKKLKPDVFSAIINNITQIDKGIEKKN